MLKNKEIALSLGVSFLYKEAPTLLEDLKSFINKNFGFGDFVFCDNAGRQVGCAKNLTELEEQLAKVPISSIVYHASRNHFSNWLKARTEFWLAHQLRPKKVEHFSTPEDLRKLLIDSVRQFRKSQQVGVISDFNKKNSMHLQHLPV